MRNLRTREHRGGRISWHISTWTWPRPRLQPLGARILPLSNGMAPSRLCPLSQRYPQTHRSSSSLLVRLCLFEKSPSYGQSVLYWLLITQSNKFSFHVDTKKNQNGYIWLAFENLLNLNMYMCIFIDKKLVSLCFSVVNNRQLHVYVCFQRPTEQFWTRFCVSPPPPCLTDRSPCWSTTPVSWTLMWSGGTSDRN